MKRLIFIALCLSACTSVKVRQDCLVGINDDKYKFETQYAAKDLDSSEYRQVLVDLMGEVDAVELSNRIFRAAGRDYCADDWNAMRWSIQETINAIEQVNR
jgi:hypothetical protein